MAEYVCFNIWPCRYIHTADSVMTKSSENVFFFFFVGLPVTIARAGLVPFLISFLVGFLVQVRNLYFFFFLVVFILTLFWILSSISNDFNISKLTWFFKSATSFGNYEGASFSIHIFIFLFYWTIFWHLMELILTSQYLQF